MEKHASNFIMLVTSNLLIPNKVAKVKEMEKNKEKRYEVANLFEGTIKVKLVNQGLTENALDSKKSSGDK